MKIIILRSIMGAFTGIGIGQVVSLAVNAVKGSGEYDFVVPAFQAFVGNPLLAAVIQTVLCAVLGMIFTLSQRIWENEKWSLLKRSAVYFLVTLIPTMGIAAYLRWIQGGWLGFLSFALIFTAIFAAIWVITYIAIRRQIRAMNQKIEQK